MNAAEPVEHLVPEASGVLQRADVVGDPQDAVTPPSPSIAAAIASGSTSATTTRMPAARNRAASALPMPPAPPVTTHTLSVRSFVHVPVTVMPPPLSSAIQ